MNLRSLFVSLIALSALGIVGNLSSRAGDAKKDDKPAGFGVAKLGPEHAGLAKIAGTFDAKVKMLDPKGGGDWLDSSGVMKRTVILDGRYVKEDYTGEFFAQKFKGMGLIGYDQEKKKYVNVWIDTMSTGFATSEGDFDLSTKTMTCHGEGVMGGKKMKTKDVLKIVSADEQHMEMYRSMDGKEFKVMEITFTRAKGTKKDNKDK